MPDNPDASSAATDMGAILLIDDDDLVLQSLSLTLDDSGYTVTTANSGQKAVAICRTESFEVVICDIRMPGMNGIDTLRAIKEIQPDVRTVVITGYASDSDAPVEAVRLGVDDYLLKPFADDLLLHQPRAERQALPAAGRQRPTHPGAEGRQRSVEVGEHPAKASGSRPASVRRYRRHQQRHGGRLPPHSAGPQQRHHRAPEW